MHHAISHTTRFVYRSPISESLMEVRMQPRSEGSQRTHRFELQTRPRSRVLAYRDASGNAVHHFDIPGRHSQLVITARATVEMFPIPPVPGGVPHAAWDALDRSSDAGEHWEYRHNSRFVTDTPLLADLARSLGVDSRCADPLAIVRRITTGIAERFDYVPKSTRVDSPIDEALANGRGVCQDFSHIMIALLRRLDIPARYVSGYLAPDPEHHDRSEPGATHAWVETWVPELGWLGFDPTNATEARERHVRVAIGRDYADVPPARGVFKGDAASELTVAVTVEPVSAAPPPMALGEPVWGYRETYTPSTDRSGPDYLEQQQQQQQ